MTTGMGTVCPMRSGLLLRIQTGEHTAQPAGITHAGEHGSNIFSSLNSDVIRVPTWDITSSSILEGR